jgi:ribosomal protein S8
MKNNREKLSEVLKKRGYKNEDLINEIEQIYNKQQLPIHGVVVELPSKNSKEFKDWLKSEGYKNKGFGIYQKENKDYCYTLLYKHYCNVLEFGN